MNENINLVEILKDCPKRFELYSTIHGKVYFNIITKNEEYPICIKHNDLIHFTENGKYLIDEPNGECILLPSKEQRDWSKFEAPWYKKEKFDPNTLKPFDKVLVRNTYSDIWSCGLFSHIIVSNDMYIYTVDRFLYKMCIPYNDNTKHLVGTKEDAPEYYRYWEIDIKIRK